MSVLITNLGNSDISVKDINGEELLFRKDVIFREFSKLLDESINNKKLIWNENIDIVFDEYLTMTFYKIKQISLPIFKNVLKYFEDKKLSEIYFFCSNQKDEHANTQDTIFLYNIFEKIFSQNLIDIKINKIELNKNPADFDEIINEIEEKIPKNLVGKNIYILLSAGTPAMMHSLAEISAKLYPEAKHIYQMRPKDKKELIKEIRIYNEKEKKNHIESFMKLFEKNNYEGCLILQDKLFFKNDKALNLFFKSLEFRKNYNFLESYNIANEIKNNKPSFYNEIVNYMSYLPNLISCFSKTNKSNIPEYLNENFGYVFWENYFNIEFYFKNNQVLMALALFYSLIDIMYYFLISKYLNKNLCFENNKVKIPLLNDFVFGNDELKNKISKEVKENLNEANKVVNNSGEVLREIIKWISNKNDNQLIKKFNEIYVNFKFHDLRNLRNHSPIGHNIQGFSKKEIIAVMDNSIEDFLKELKNYISLIIPEPANYYEMSDVIRKYLENKI